MEDKLISAKALLDKLPIVEDWDKQVSLAGALADFIILICDVPAIEAKPVVHAHWEIEYDDDDNIKKCYCSNCGVGCEPMNYCGFCGAQMDEEFASDINVGSKGVKIPVINMEDVPKKMEEMEK